MNWTETSGLGSDDTKRALRELVALGLDDEIYRNFVHLAGHPISDMPGYEVAQYEPYSDDVLLDRKLEWMLRTYLKGVCHRAERTCIWR